MTADTIASAFAKLFFLAIFLLLLRFCFWGRTARSSSGFANTAMFCGFLGMLIVPALLAIPLGHMGLRTIRKSSGSLRGRGRAIFGLLVGYATLTYLVGMTGFVGGSVLEKYEAYAAARQNLEAISTAKEMWAKTENLGPGAVPTVEDLAPFMPDGIFPEARHGVTYQINAIGTPPAVKWPPVEY